jgi:eukaryotic-like serine/threonine-protein kinase
MSEPEEVVSGEGDNRRTDPTAAPITEPESVRASAPTIQGDSDPSVTPRKPVVIRTPIPPTAIDSVVPSLSTTTPTGRSSPISGKPISTTLRSGAGRTLIGTTLGRYEILEELGHGGMATVYRARDPRLERDVALKVIHRHLRDNPEIAERFRHEARAVAKLKHPSIVEIYDVPDIDDEERFLVAELVDGPSLRKYLQNLRSDLGHDSPGLFPPELAAALVLQILSALGRAHQEGIVHRDVKPENILIAGLRGEGESARSSQRPSDPTRPAPVAKLTDFGIAKILDAQSMTSTGQILGSPAHMAPEQIESGDITPRVDIFATGVLFYELLTGQLPFDGKNPAQVIRRVLEGEFTPAERAAPTVGGRWSGIVAAMLTRDPERRPANVDVVETAIRAELDAMGVKEPDRELLDFVHEPKAIASKWGERMKPILLERAMAARERGDVVGSAHDLNRALAYDPTDPKLVRAVTTLRSRERRMRGLKRAIPLIVAALLVSGGTFGVVRWARNRAQITPLASSSVAPEPTRSASADPSVSVSAPVIDSGLPSATVAVLNTVPPVVTGPAPDAASNKRRVRFNVFPPGNYSIDGGASHDTFGDPVQELTLGEHTISITGRSACCEPFTQKFRVEAGDGEQAQPFKLVLKPAKVIVTGAEGAKVTVVRQSDGTQIASGSAPLSVVLSETQVPVTITVEATGFPTKSQNVTLVPGDARYVQFE